MTLIIFISAIILLSLLGYIIYFLVKRKKRGDSKKNIKIKINKKEKKKSFDEVKGSYCDVVEKFMFNKEVKIMNLINKILPSDYVLFPKIGADKILEPVGNPNLYNSIKGKYLDFVIFDAKNMKPKVVIDTYDGSLDNEQLDLQAPEVFQAISSAELPIVEIKVKFEYLEEEIKNPIFEALGLIKKEEAINEQSNNDTSNNNV